MDVVVAAGGAPIALPWPGPVYVLLVVWMLLLGWTDLRERRLPDWLTLGGAAAVAVGVLCGIVLGAFPAAAARTAALGAFTLAGLLAAQRLLAPGSLGAGDVKLAVPLGAVAGLHGPGAWLCVLLGAPVLTVFAAVFLGVRRGLLPRDLPHGPSLCAATAFGVFLALTTA